GELGLAAEAPERRLVGQEPRRQELERHVAAELDVVRAVDHPHAASAQLGLDAIARDGLADHRELMIAGGCGRAGLGGGVVGRRRRGSTNRSRRTFWTGLSGGLRPPSPPWINA